MALKAVGWYVMDAVVYWSVDLGSAVVFDMVHGASPAGLAVADSSNYKYEQINLLVCVFGLVLRIKCKCNKSPWHAE